MAIMEGHTLLLFIYVFILLTIKQQHLDIFTLRYDYFKRVNIMLSFDVLNLRLKTVH